MSINNVFSRIKREIGIKKCVVIDGNIGDVFLNERNKMLNIQDYVSEIMKDLEFEDILYWDRVSGLTGNTSNLKLTDDVEVTGDEYDFEDEEVQATTSFKTPSEVFNIIFKNMTKIDLKTAFILNWGDYVFSSQNQFDNDEKENLTLLGKALKDKKVEFLNDDVNESTIVILVNKLSNFPISFYQGNPEVSIITMQKPDRKEREKMIKKLEHQFRVKLSPGETILTCDKSKQYVDMLDDFTNREILQMSKLSRKEERMTFDKLFYLFMYGEKDNPWENLDYDRVRKIKSILSDKVVGQNEAIEKIEKVVVKAFMGLTGLHKSSSRSMPKGVLFFVGPTGVGKTELSKQLAHFLFGREDAFIRFDMSEFAQENSDQKLIGAPPGFVGYEEGGQLTNAVKEKPFSVILFDEIEKAAKPNPRILDIFLQILEDGRLTDSKGETVYFSETVIVFTSNLGASQVVSKSNKEEVADEFISIVKNYFDNELNRPEILGRIGYRNIVPFNFILDKDFQAQIANSKLIPIQKGIYEKYKINLVFDDQVKLINYILKDADIAKGGRDILNAINDNLLDELSMFMFENKNDLGIYRDADIRASVEKGKLEFEFEL